MSTSYEYHENNNNNRFSARAARGDCLLVIFEFVEWKSKKIIRLSVVEIARAAGIVERVARLA